MTAERWLRRVGGGWLGLLGGDVDLRSLGAVSVCEGLSLAGGGSLSLLGGVGYGSLGALRCGSFNVSRRVIRFITQ